MVTSVAKTFLWQINEIVALIAMQELNVRPHPLNLH